MKKRMVSELTQSELAAVKFYDRGEEPRFISKMLGISQKDILQAVRVMRAARMQIPEQCRHCGFRQSERPCVFPASLCGFGRRSKNKVEG